YYKEHIQKYQEPEMVSACHILIKKSSDHDAAQAKLTEVQKKLSEGVPCETVAKEYSEGPKASEGGDLGFFARGKMLPQIEEKAFQLNVGEISPVIESDIGYHIIQLKARKKERVKPLSEVYSEIQDIIQQGKIQEARTAWLKELRKKAYIAIYI
ncbi:MAG: peptidylprolyl isomerase, partial [Chlamydiota bacterium]|nr:peptidylprolyl isomerase [Chlamydiota bacterium]